MDQVKKKELSTSIEKSTVLSACQLSSSIVLDAYCSIVIPKGYACILGKPITWKVSMDRHTLKAIANEVTVPGTAIINNGHDIIDTMVRLYQVRIVGVLFYNVVIGDFIPVKSFGGENKGSVFTQYGSIPVNFEAGYVSNLDDIRPDIINTMNFNTIIENPNIVVSGEEIVFNPLSPELFYEAFNGLQDITINVGFTELISSNPIIS